MKITIQLVLILLVLKSVAQDTSKAVVTLSGFTDVYYVYDFSKPSTTKRLPFLYNHTRHNATSLNMGFIRMEVDHRLYRANIALMSGTYAYDNYIAEPELLKHVYEGHGGFALDAKSKWWVDAGVFGSHIGFESAVSKDNPTLTRSLAAENSPYFLTGAKLSYKKDSLWEYAVLVCNGWQRIQMVQGNSLPAVCTQVKYGSSDKVLLNWSTFVGTDDPDTLRRMRYFNNLYFQMAVTKQFHLTAAFDIGYQQTIKHGKAYSNWFTPILIGRYSFNSRYALAVRGEYFNDQDGVIIANPFGKQFDVIGTSINFDYSPVANAMWRIEGKWYTSSSTQFAATGWQARNNFALTTSFAIGF